MAVDWTRPDRAGPQEGSSEYTTDDSEGEGPGARQLMKPVFVPKTDREVGGVA